MSTPASKRVLRTLLGSTGLVALVGAILFANSGSGGVPRAAENTDAALDLVEPVGGGVSATSDAPTFFGFIVSVDGYDVSVLDPAAGATPVAYTIAPEAALTVWFGGDTVAGTVAAVRSGARISGLAVDGVIERADVESMPDGCTARIDTLTSVRGLHDGRTQLTLATGGVREMIGATARTLEFSVVPVQDLVDRPVVVGACGTDVRAVYEAVR